MELFKSNELPWWNSSNVSQCQWIFVNISFNFVIIFWAKLVINWIFCNDFKHRMKYLSKIKNYKMLFFVNLKINPNKCVPIDCIVIELLQNFYNV